MRAGARGAGRPPGRPAAGRRSGDGWARSPGPRRCRPRGALRGPKPGVRRRATSAPRAGAASRAGAPPSPDPPWADAPRAVGALPRARLRRRRRRAPHARRPPTGRTTRSGAPRGRRRVPSRLVSCALSLKAGEGRAVRRSGSPKDTDQPPLQQQVAEPRLPSPGGCPAVRPARRGVRPGAGSSHAAKWVRASEPGSVESERRRSCERRVLTRARASLGTLVSRRHRPVAVLPPHLRTRHERSQDARSQEEPPARGRRGAPWTRRRTSRPAAARAQSPPAATPVSFGATGAGGASHPASQHWPGWAARLPARVSASASSATRPRSMSRSTSAFRSSIG